MRLIGLELVLALSLTLAALATEAQQAARMPHVGVLRAGSPPDPSIEVFRAALRYLGYVAGQTIVVTERWAEGRHERPEVDGKRLQLLREVAPNVFRIAILLAPTGNPAARLRWRESQVAAERLGVSLYAVEVASPFDFASAFAAIRQERAGALLVTAFLTTNQKDRQAIVELAAKHRLPTVYDRKEAVEAGGLMAYGPSFTDAYRRAAIYVDKILKGAKPADLPVEQPTKFELVINMKTAKALGLTIPQTLLLQADQVIE